MRDYDYYMAATQGEQPPEYEEDTPMLTQCEATESGAVQCEVLLTDPDEEHGHWISDATIERTLGRRNW